MGSRQGCIISLVPRSSKVWTAAASKGTPLLGRKAAEARAKAVPLFPAAGRTTVLCTLHRPLLTVCCAFGLSCALHSAPTFACRVLRLWSELCSALCTDLCLPCVAPLV